ncbi:unnamed protein product [Linum tenue]|uniref:non-specific serine/threonine protein kinase n=1 Tax=Linum tenue TaxID=586396 RepID=A0AAV0M017_9ROSI|nr:unnamed protein product [Linum tenue]
MALELNSPASTCLLMLLCFWVFTGSLVSCLSYDGLALLSLFNRWEASSVPRPVVSSWNASDQTPCSWVGVECHNFTRRVVSLNLTGYSISGELGPEIGGLSRLATLDLSYNNFSGEIPWLLGNCAGLEYLDLSNNGFTGRIPGSFRNLRRVKTLSLFTNSLSGEIPESLFQNTPLLQYGYLHENAFNGSVPGSVGELNEIVELWLYGNSFTGSIPDSIGNCRKLQTLYLQDNQLTGSLPGSLGSLRELVNLYVSHNSLEGRIPSGFGNLKSLSFLDLSYNPFSGGIPEDLGNCSSLNTLAIVHSNLTGNIPSSLGLLENLSSLDLSENQLYGKIPPELGNCKLLTSLKLYSNKLEGGIPGEIGLLPQLRDLELFNNNLSGEIPITIWKNPSLEFLLVYQNRLYGELPVEMTELKQLKNLSLYENQFSGVIPQSLGINSSLLQLDFTSNQFTGEIPPNLCFGKQLRVLNMGKNQLKGSVPSDVGQCSTLWRMILSENHLSGPLPEFAENSSLSRVDISRNDINGSLPWSLKHCGNLTFLNLSMNKLTGSIPREIGDLVKLDTLDLSDNQLEGSLPSELSNCYQLEKLDVGFNSLTGSIPTGFRNWTKLATLVLSENRFTGGIPSFLSSLGELEELDLGGNSLGGEIPSSLGSLQSLRYGLNLSSNGLTGLIPLSLGKLNMLEQLDIANNKLTGSLEPLENIRTLLLINVSYNLLTGPIPETLYRFLISSPSAFLGNPSLCIDCHRNQTDGVCTSNTGIKPCQSKKRGHSILEVAAISLATIIVVLSLLGLCCLIIVWRPKRCHEIVAAGLEGPPSLLNKVMEATEDLNEKHVIGRGGHGTVYKVPMEDGEIFAVKKVNFAGQRAGSRSMMREIKTIGKIRHRNLIKLEDFWLRKEYGLLLYSYMENGSLYDVLHGNFEETIEWDVRFRIALGTAHALEYLHYDCNPPIVHCDIKPQNILLDSDMEPHISDFGIAKLLDQSSGSSTQSMMVDGTVGYIAPEMAFATSKSKASDVYSYGVVLLELITGKKAVDRSFPEGIDIVTWVRSTWDADPDQDVKSIADPRLADADQELFLDSSAMERIERVIMVALRCTEKEPNKRPTMRDVVKELLGPNVPLTKPMQVAADIACSSDFTKQ